MGRPFNSEASFDRYVYPEPNSGCWLWTGETARGGYGRFHYNYNRVPAHRFAFERENGPVPPGKLLLHSCDVPCCVNPAHLRIGTHLDNQADAISRGRHTHGEKHGAAKLTEADVLAIRAATGKQADIAAKYEVTQALVSAIKTRRVWRHI